VLVIGGATGYAGAAALAARAASRSGAGLVSVLTPRPVYPLVASGALEAMAHPGEETETGSLSLRAWESWRKRLTDFDAVAVGPGMTRHADTAGWIRSLLMECRRPLLLDADALNALEGSPELVARAQCPVVLTPHPGEMARLLGCGAAEVQADREGAAEQLAKRTKAVVVLKGAGTIVAQEGRPLHVNMTGNPGMASGGMGDVLAGLIGGLLAQGIPPFDAACAGVFLHGRAGDNAAWRLSQAGLTANDLIEDIPFMFREVMAR
jgi:NAD(P)H-hydrate epimerase